MNVDVETDFAVQIKNPQPDGLEISLSHGALRCRRAKIVDHTANSVNRNSPRLARIFISYIFEGRFVSVRH